MGLPLPDKFDVPLFPLPDSVLFPGMVLPLHIFEPRYRQMLKFALESDKLIALGHLKPNWKNDYYGNPPVYPVACVGRIAANQLKEDGTSNIALIGISRCIIRTEPQNEPFRIATVEILKDTVIYSTQEKQLARELFGKLQRVAAELMTHCVHNELLETMQKAFSERTDIGNAADFLASVFIKDVQVRQSLLEETHPLVRGSAVLKNLQYFAAQLHHEPSPPPSSGRLDEYSMN